MIFWEVPVKVWTVKPLRPFANALFSNSLVMLSAVTTSTEMRFLGAVELLATPWTESPEETVRFPQ
jgi:hypothetical protein